ASTRARGARDGVGARGRSLPRDLRTGGLIVTLAGLIIDSKSQWDPPIRREHSLARLARRAGHPTAFVERPVDVRAVGRATHRRAWLKRLSGQTVSVDADL